MEPKINVLAVSQRPRRFRDVLGQDHIVRGIRRQIRSGRVPRAWLFSGDTGSGKTTIARILAYSLECNHQKKFGNPCQACLREDNFDIREIDCAGVGVDVIRDALEASIYEPWGNYRIFILDEAHMLSEEAQSALLKPTEDGPSKTVWMFCTTYHNGLLATLKRRCQHYPLRELLDPDIQTLLQRLGRKVGLNQEQILAFGNEAKKLQVRLPGKLLSALESFAAGMEARDSLRLQ